MIILKLLLTLTTFLMFDVVFKVPDLRLVVCFFLAAFLFSKSKSDATSSSFRKPIELQKTNINGLPMMGNADTRGNAFGSSRNGPFNSK